MQSGGQIVVGVDGSEGGPRALAWAARQAAMQGATVQAVLAWGPAETGSDSEAERARVATLLKHEIDAVPAYQRSGATIASEAVEGSPAQVLTAAARSADLLVLGSHGHSRVQHTVLGSVNEECIRRAVCPVVVIPVRAAEKADAEPAVYL